jgi:hypothetical protein
MIKNHRELVKIIENPARAAAITPIAKIPKR